MPRKFFPEFVAPMMASVVKEPFNHPDWIFESKLDGFRAVAVIDSAGKGRLWSRSKLPLEPKFPSTESRSAVTSRIVGLTCSGSQKRRDWKVLSPNERLVRIKLAGAHRIG